MRIKTIITGFVLFLSSFHLSNADVLKTYVVIGGKTDTQAIIYREPTVHSDTLHILPVGSKGIVALSKPRKYGSKRWQNVVWQGKKGWMLFKHLKYDKDTSKKMNEQSCDIDSLKECL